MEIIYPNEFINLIEEEDLNKSNFDRNIVDDYRFPPMAPPPPMNNFNNSPNSKPPMGPPPSYTPSKSNKSVQSINESPNTKSVSGNTIRFCLYKYSYIWQTNGRGYWAYLISVDKRSIAGFRWINYRWVYFGLDLRLIDSFQC
ncbi:MAG: hypothetical protein ACRDD2_12900 [Sarcina sp.]